MTDPDKLLAEMPRLAPYKLTARQAAFVDEYLVDRNATQAALRAGYSAKTAASQGGRLLQNAEVRAAIDERIAASSRKLQLTAEALDAEAARLALYDIGRAFDEDGNLKPLHEMDEDTRRAIQAVEVEELYAGRGDSREQIGNVRKVKFADKRAAIELGMKRLRLLGDQVNVNVAVGLRLEIHL